MSDEALDQHLRQMQAYYGRRAPEYEAIYYRPDGDRAQELRQLQDECRRGFAGRRVLEVACGTAFWTSTIADNALSIVATDASEDMLSLAREKGLSSDKVEFHIADAYDLAGVQGEFDAGMANFWVSHVPKRRLDGFLRGLHKRIGSGARVMMMDNVEIAGQGGELMRLDDVEDDFRMRELSDGTTHPVLKNYYVADELEAVYSPHANDLRVEVWDYYWWVTYEVR